MATSSQLCVVPGCSKAYNHEGSCVSLTANELAVLNAIDESEYGDTLRDPVWTFTIEDNSALSGRVISGVVSSLHKKGLVISSGSGRDQQIEITAKGVEAFIAATKMAGGMLIKKVL